MECPLLSHMQLYECKVGVAILWATYQLDTKADYFIYGIMTTTVDNLSNLERIEVGPSTAIHAISHNIIGKTLIPCQDIISDEKNEVEGGPEEKKICVG